MRKPFPYRYRIVIFLFLLSMITYLDRVTISLVGVRIKSAFALNNSEFGWVLGAFSLAYAFFEIPGGIMGDLRGQKLALVRIVTMWSVFTAFTGLATGLFTLILARFFFGIGEAGAVPNTTGVISRWLPAGEISRGVISSLSGQPAGAALAPLIVVPIAAAFGWRAPFFVNGVIGILWVIICIRWFRDNPSEMKGISQDEKLLIETNRHYGKINGQFPWSKVLRSKTLIAVSIAHFCSQWSNYFFIAWLPVYLQQGRHFSEKNMSAVVSTAFLPAIVLGFFCGLVSDKLIEKIGLTYTRRFVGVLTLGILALFFIIAASSSNNLLLVIMLPISYVFQMFFATTSFGVCVDISGN